MSDHLWSNISDSFRILLKAENLLIFIWFRKRYRPLRKLVLSWNCYGKYLHFDQNRNIKIATKVFCFKSKTIPRNREDSKIAKNIRTLGHQKPITKQDKGTIPDVYELLENITSWLYYYCYLFRLIMYLYCSVKALSIRSKNAFQIMDFLLKHLL